MAIAVNCPSCKNTFTRVRGVGGWPVPVSALRLPRGGPGYLREAGRRPSRTHPPKGARPQLLDRLPPSPVASPAFVLGAGAFVLAYGVVMTIVLSGAKDDPATAEDFAPYEIEIADRARESSIPEPPPTGPEADRGDPEAERDDSEAEGPRSEEGERPRRNRRPSPSWRR